MTTARHGRFLGLLEENRKILYKVAATYCRNALLVVALQGLFSVDAYGALGVPYLAVNAAFCVVALAVGLVVSRRLGGDDTQRPAARRVMRALAGRDVEDAVSFLRGLARFENDASPA